MDVVDRLVEPRARDTAAPRSLRLALNRDALVPVAALALAFALWLTALPRIDLEHIPDAGLTAVLPPVWFVSAALVVGSMCIAIYRQVVPGWVLALHLILLIVIVHGTTAAIYPTPRYAWSYKHIGVEDFIQRHGGVNPVVDIYNNWPGFFALAAMFSELTGLDGALEYAAWAQLFNNLLYLGAVQLIFRAVTLDRRLIWFGSLLWILANWTGQDYFSPQGFAFFFHLIILGICLRWFRLTTPPARDSVQRWLRSRRLTSLYLWIMGRPSIDDAPEPGTRGQRAGLMVLLVLAYIAAVSSHQLTPFMSIASVVALVFVQRLSARSLPILMIILVTTWLLYMGRGFLDTRGEWLFDNIGNFNFRFAERVGLQTASEGIVLVGLAVRLSILGLWGAAGVGALRRARNGYWDLALIVLFLTPFPMRALQSYGGEMILRICFFAAPWAAILAAGLFYPSPWLGKTWKTLVSSLAFSLALLLGLTTTYYGQERTNYIRADELRAVQYLYSIAPADSAIAGPSWNTSLAFSYYEYFRHLWILEWPDYQGRDLSGESFDGIREMLQDPTYEEAYFLLTTGQKEYVSMRGMAPEGSLDRLQARLMGEPGFELIWMSPNARIWRLRRAGEGGS